ncbi:MAG: hypothetical protein ACLPTZ_22990 [Beijerinckiaceae bacterium]
MEDPKFQEFRENEPERSVPLLYHYQRSFSTLNDGKIIEHGAGFMLSFVNPKEIRETEEITYEAVGIADGINIIVGGTRAVLSSTFNIGWSNAKFTLEPQVSF